MTKKKTLTDEDKQELDESVDTWKQRLAERYGDWQQTYTGVKFHPLDPRPEDFKLEDIAHALSMLCRFNGHSKYFYSVAQHSVLASRYAEIEVETTFDAAGHVHIDYYEIEEEFDKAVELVFQRCRLDAARWGLFHDAAEAYLSDVPRPLKRTDEMAWYRLLETKMSAMIGDVFGLGPMDDIIHTVDARLLLTEKRDLMCEPPADWMVPGEPYADKIECWTPWTAKLQFLKRFDELSQRHLLLLAKEQGK